MATRVTKRKRPKIDEALPSNLTEPADEVTIKIHGRDREEYSAALHKAHLANLSETDPDFYQFLQEQDQELLEFSEDELSSQSEEIRDLSQSEEANNLSQSVEYITAAAEKVMVTHQMALKWKRSIRKDGASSPHVHDLVEALDCGIHYYMRSHDPAQFAVQPYQLSDDQVFNLLLSTSLQLLPSLLSHTSHRNKAWKKLKPTIKTFANDLLQLLDQLTDAEMLCAVLRAVRTLVTCYVTMVKLSRQLTKVLVKHWTSTSDLVCIGSFLCLRQLIHCNPQHLEPVVKQLYFSLVASARFAAPDKMKLLQRSLIELIKMDMSTAYQMAFVYIRQLAISLRNAHTTGQASTQPSIMSWYFLRCLQLWSQLLCDEPAVSLTPLVYPLVQISLSCIKLQQKANCFPFRLHIIDLLISLSRFHGCYVPIATLLIEVLEYPFPTKSLTKGKPVSLETSIRLSNQLLHSRLVQSALVDKAFELLLEHFCDLSYSIGFPELVLPAGLRLNKIAKSTKLPWLNRQIKLLVAKLEELAEQVGKERSQLPFGPCDLNQVHLWERQRKENDNCLKQFYSSWKHMKQLAIVEEQSSEE